MESGIDLCVRKLLRDDLFEGVASIGWISFSTKVGSTGGSSKSLELGSWSLDNDGWGSGRTWSLEGCLLGSDVSAGLLELASLCAEGATLGVGDCLAGSAAATGLLELATLFSFGGLWRVGATTFAARSPGSGTSFPALG